MGERAPKNVSLEDFGTDGRMDGREDACERGGWGGLGIRFYLSAKPK